MITYKTKTNPNVVETWDDTTLLTTSEPLDIADWTQFVFWVEHFTTTEPWTADFLYQCYQQDPNK